MYTNVKFTGNVRTFRTWFKGKGENEVKVEVKVGDTMSKGLGN